MLSLIVACALPLSGFAIDSEDKPDCPKKSTNKEDSVQIYEDEIKVNDTFTVSPTENVKTSNSAVVKEQATYKPYESKPTGTEKVDAEAEQHSAMSFNFIYYIIDKFKFTDPLD
jgi:hypothetical protein